MIIPVLISVRGVFFASIILLGFAIFITINNSKEKSQYDKYTGTIEYFDKEFQNLPIRNKGDYRYLKIDTYTYIFEIYEPNSEPTKNKIDDLKVGNTVDIYCYETSNTRNEGINRFIQYIDKQNQPYFIRNGFQKQLGYVLIGLCISINLITLLLWKKGKLIW